MVTQVLAFLMGVAVYVGGVSLLAGLRSPDLRRHLAMAPLALALAAYLGLSIALRDVATPAAYAELARWQGAVAAGVGIALFWFVAVYTGVRPTALLALITLLLVGVAAIDLTLPGGIFFGGVPKLVRVTLPWGEVTNVPVQSHSHLQWLFNLALWGPFLYVGYAIVQQWRRGERRAAGMLAAALLASGTPGFIDSVIRADTTFAFPYTELGFAFFLTLMSVHLARDVVQSAEARRDLAASEQRFRALVESAPDAIAIIRPGDYRVVQINQRAREMFGLGSDGPEHLSLADFAAPTQPDGRASSDAIEAYVRRALAGESLAREWVAQRADGTRFTTEARMSRLQGGDTPLIRVSVLDISERKEAERRERELQEQLLQSQKLETIGTLAGGIAHDFNNLLTPILGYADIALETLGPNHPLESDLRALRQAAERARDLVRQILAFSKQAPHRASVVVIQDVVKQAARLLEATLPARIRMDLELEAPDARVALDAARIQQIVMNLGTNAVQAMPEGGRLHIALHAAAAPADVRHGPVEPGSGEGGLQPRVSGDGGWVALEVTDTGPGIRPEDRPRLFDPFFSTKPPGQGTGLGLSVVHGIVAQSGGTVEVNSAPGAGACFRVLLPRTQAEASAVPHEAARQSRAPAADVLLVDDNARVLAVLARLVSGLGYRVDAQGSGEAALGQARERPTPYSVALVDYDMPGLRGDQLAVRLKELQPGLPVVCLSGTPVSPERLERFDGFLLKPPSARSLEEALEQAMEGKGTERRRTSEPGRR